MSPEHIRLFAGDEVQEGMMAYAKGRQARGNLSYAATTQLARCPYPDGSRHAAEWREGWMVRHNELVYITVRPVKMPRPKAGHIV